MANFVINNNKNNAFLYFQFNSIQFSDKIEMIPQKKNDNQ